MQQTTALFVVIAVLVVILSAADGLKPTTPKGKMTGRVECDTEYDSIKQLYACRLGSHKFVTARSNKPNAPPAPSWGGWSDDIATTGWASLWVVSNASFTAVDQMYAAGWLEGYQSHHRISDHFRNTFQATLSGSPPDAYTKVLGFISTQYDWWMDMIQKYAAATPTSTTAAARHRKHRRRSIDQPTLWQSVNLTLTHVRGMVDGYNTGRDPYHEQPLALIDFLFANMANDDMTEVLGMLFIDNQKNCWQQSQSEALSNIRKSSHCSALIKPVKHRHSLTGREEYTNLHVSHNSWFDYRVMIRVFKSYHFDVSADMPAIGDYNVIFSSYPGWPWSGDDFYMIKASKPPSMLQLQQTKKKQREDWTPVSLYVMETTNNVCNISLLSLVVPQSLLTWQRTLLSNMLAVDGESWTSIFAQYNSGTYNNQMQIVDFTRFTPGQTRLSDGLVWIIEQMPGAAPAGDVTDVVRRQHYWASYNVPYFNETWIGLGYAATAEVYGNEYTHDHCARANLFRRDHHSVEDSESLKRLMRSNHWQTDPLSDDNPYWAIAARGDLMPGEVGIPWVNKSAVGCVDGKIANVEYMRLMITEAVSGPTADSQPPFSWNDPDWANLSHVGQPDTWNFSWQPFTLVP